MQQSLLCYHVPDFNIDSDIKFDVFIKTSVLYILYVRYNQLEIWKNYVLMKINGVFTYWLPKTIYCTSLISTIYAESSIYILLCYRLLQTFSLHFFDLAYNGMAIAFESGIPFDTFSIKLPGMDSNHILAVIHILVFPGNTTCYIHVPHYNFFLW